MRKLKLNEEDLAVETFDVVAAGTAGTGTVRGAGYETENALATCLVGACTCNDTCAGLQTCDLSECCMDDAGAAHALPAD